LPVHNKHTQGLLRKAPRSRAGKKEKKKNAGLCRHVSIFAVVIVLAGIVAVWCILSGRDRPFWY